ncbi:MAG: hypothetical protein ACLQBL_35045 [Polyangiaceae bacterium]
MSEKRLAAALAWSSEPWDEKNNGIHDSFTPLEGLNYKNGPISALACLRFRGSLEATKRGPMHEHEGQARQDLYARHRQPHPAIVVQPFSATWPLAFWPGDVDDGPHAETDPDQIAKKAGLWIQSLGA